MNDARKANNAFERGDYAESVQLYRQAIDQNPEDARLHFNLARALYELGEGDAAMEAYDRFKNLTDSPVEQSFADYNKGRMLTDQENYGEAVDFFREALKKNPNDPDAKYNYELALQKQQEQENQQEQSESDSDENDDEQDDSQQQDNQQDQDQDQEQDPNSDSQQQSGQPEPEEADSQEQQQNPLEMTPEEAQNILDALEQLERELLENQKKESTEPPSGNEKDW
ncbi:MAG: tetratricopeptide repeat protein [Balneolaceae bacterium]